MEETLSSGLVRGEARDTVRGAIGVEMGYGMKPGLVGNKNSKAHRDTGDRNDNPPPIFCLSIRKGRRDPTQTHLHMCVHMHTCSHRLALTLLRPLCPHCFLYTFPSP